MNDQIPLYLGIPLAALLISFTLLIILMFIQVWLDHRD